MPRVSVIIPAYNATAYLSRSISSVIAQSERDWELIVVDDGSTDQTCAVAQGYAARDDRVVVLRLETNGGAGRARNRGIAVARGRWITLLDADDHYDPRRLESLVGLAVRTGARVVIDNQFFVLEGRHHPWRALFEPDRDASIWLDVNDVLRGNRAFGMFNIGLTKPLFEAEFVKRENLRYVEDLRIGEDYVMLLTLCARAGKILFHQKSLYYYFFRKDSLSRSTNVRDFLRLFDVLAPILEDLRSRGADKAEIDALHADVEAYLACHVAAELLGRGRIRDVPLLLSAANLRALLRLVLHKACRELAMLWPRHPPRLVTCWLGPRIEPSGSRRLSAKFSIGL